MRKMLVRAIVALFVSCGGSVAAQTPSVTVEPIHDCRTAVGKWHNAYDVWINLTIHPLTCAFEGAAKARSGLAGLLMGSEVRPFADTAYTHQGGLIVRLGGSDDTVSHLLLTRKTLRFGGTILERLSGTITIKGRGTYDIELQSVERFPIDLK